MPSNQDKCLNNVPQKWAENWSLKSLEFELRRRDLCWAILNDTMTNYQRRKIAILAIEADSQIRGCDSIHQMETD